MTTAIYHEKQNLQLCALHALNNLFQKEKTFTKEEMDGYCELLSPRAWVNPHRSIIGWGNYDVNVVIKALEHHGYEAMWFDKRKNPGCLRLDCIFGFIMNIPSDYHLGYLALPLSRRHWIAIRKINDCYYNLDSKLKAPQAIGGDGNLLQFLTDHLKSKDELFVIIPSDVTDWKLEDPNENQVEKNGHGDE